LSRKSMSVVQFQILSDLHLEINVDNISLGSMFERNPSEKTKLLYEEYLRHPERLPPFEVAAPYLLLLGDIGLPSTWVYKHFLRSQAERFKKVIVLTGNHEYYSTPRWKTHFEEVENEIRSLCAEIPNIIFLHKESILLDGIRILGATLWEPIAYSSNDTVKICNKEGNIVEFAELKSRHDDELQWIKSQLKEAKKHKEPVVVLTHHPPFEVASDIIKDPVVAWLYGHSHISFGTTRKKVLIASNQLGYLQLGEKDPEFRSEFVVEINTKTNVHRIVKARSHYLELMIAKEKEETEKLMNFIPKTAPPPPLLPKKKFK